MPERATINQTNQWGPEVTPGTEVDANKAMAAMMVEMGPEVEISRYRPAGGKFETTVSLDREWTGATLSGPITYNEIIYPLSSVLAKVTPTGAGTAKTWAFTPAQTAADIIQTYTVEAGSAVRATLFTYGLVTEFGMSFSTQGNELSGEMIGKAFQDGITMTASPTQLALRPVLSKHVAVKYATTFAGLGAAAILTRVVSVSWNIRNRFGPVWVLNQSTDWAAHVELPIELELTIRQQADAQGMGFLPLMRNSTTGFLRIDAISEELAETGIPFSIRADTAFKVVGVSRFEDEEGQLVLEWTLGGIYDTVWGNATSVTVVNTNTAL